METKQGKTIVTMEHKQIVYDLSNYIKMELSFLNAKACCKFLSTPLSQTISEIH